MVKRLLVAVTTVIIALAIAWGWVAVGIGPRFAPPLALSAGIVAAALIVFSGVWTAPVVSHSRRARLVIATLALLLALPGLLATAVVSCQFANDCRLERFASQIRSAMPSEVAVEQADLRVAVITGNGDHCDFQAYFFVSSDTGKNSLVDHLRGLTLEPAMPGGTGQLLAVEIIELPGQPGRFRVGTIDSPYPAGLDLRCT